MQLTKADFLRPSRPVKLHRNRNQTECEVPLPDGSCHTYKNTRIWGAKDV